MGKSAESGVDVLLVEDNPGDVRLVEEALRETPSALHIVKNGREALDFIHRRDEFADAPSPDVVLLDLNLPKVDGTEVLDEIRSDPGLSDVRVIVITSARAQYADIDSGDVDDVDFLTKPTDPDEFISDVRSTIFQES